MIKVLSIFGTRPEAIKMAPVIQALAEQVDVFDSKVCVTAQHRSMLDQSLDVFGIVPDYDLDLMADDQSPTQVAAAVLSKLEPILKSEAPDWVLLQGDTMTTAAAALAAFYAGVKIGHIEAGLRTGDKSQPFPEEINRRITSLVADLHFAPTEHCRQNLLLEGVPERRVLVTGNSIIDALHSVLRRPVPAEILELLNRIGVDASSFGFTVDPKLILVTAHRRENFGVPLENICQALRTIAAEYGSQVQIVYPVHPNPNVAVPVHRILNGISNVTLLPPLDYASMINLANSSYMIVTDSGGLQEEAPSLGKPVLVLRNVTERTETVRKGTACVVGIETEEMVGQMSRLLENETDYRAMISSENPYGDGKTSERIVRALQNWQERHNPSTSGPSDAELQRNKNFRPGD